METVGYVSDERFVAVADALVDFERDGEIVASVRTGARGSVLASVEPGHYTISIASPGFGSKVIDVELPIESPIQIRLLSDGMLGYAWPKWVRSGERSEFRVHAVEPYRLSLWRYGIEREFVKLIGWFDEHGPRANMQITPDGDYTQTGVQWNRVGWGSPHHTQFVTAPERSGLYYFHAEAESGSFFSFPWIVAPAQPSVKMAFVCATNTWNAYNNFGGRSNYICATRLPERPIVNARQELQRYLQAGSYNQWMFPDEQYLPLSFDRPEPHNCVRKDEEATDPIRGRSECHLAPAEWRLLAWLEREGFEYDVYAEPQLHDGTLNLDSYSVLILGAHPEYWSRETYWRVKEWVFERGGKLLYPGGNGLNCEIEYVGESAMRFRTWNPSSNVMGGEFESRFDRCVESEANLLGVVCTDAGIMTAAPYRVIAPDHWIFGGTGLRAGDTFGERSLHERCPGGASGHETDKRSASSPPATILLAKGLNPDDGGAEMVYHETASGGAVFSTGSITWAASLLVDEHVSRITRNVIEEFLK